MDTGELENILEVSRRNNSEKGITGMLIYADGSIIQLLEGKKEVIMSTYRKILHDPRHSGIIKLKEGELTERNFSQWSMGFESVSKLKSKDLIEYKKLKETVGSVSDNSRHPALILMMSFLKNNVFR